MNREQMIAWLTLEGWVLYNRPSEDSHPIITQNGKSGIAPEIGGLTCLCGLSGDDEKKDWSTVSDDHLVAMYQKAAA